MKRFALFLALLVVALCAAPVVAQEKYTIKLPYRTKGSVVQVDETKAANAKTSITVDGKTQDTKEDKATSISYKEETLEGDPGKPGTKIKRTYQKADLTKDGKKVSAPVVGKEVVIEYDKKKYTFTINGKAATEEEAAFLKQDFDMSPEDGPKTDAAIMPTKAVGVNEVWKPDLDAVVKAVKEAAIEFDPKKSTSAGKLVKTYKKGGVQHGVIEIEFTLLVTKFTVEGNPLPLAEGSTMKQTFRFEGCIDGSEQTGKLDTLLETRLLVNTKSPDGKEVKVVQTSREPVSRETKNLSEKK